ncbi:helix-turn-helix transcriptional regulator [Mycobacterium sp. NPDC003323]
MDGQAVGEFVRAIRECRDPVAFGFPTKGRRTSGLRRSEVAALAHISVEHYTNLERARGSGPSEQVLGAVADALRLDADERRHLFQLAGRNAPWGDEPSTDLSPSVAKLIRGLGSTAAMVLSARFDILAWNAAAADLMEDFGALAPVERNIARRHFLSERGHYGMSHAEEFSRMVAGQLRATAARYPRDKQTYRLIEDLLAGSPAFTDLWSDATAINTTHMIKRLDHPQRGHLTLSCDALMDPHRDQTIVMFSVID